MEQNKDDHLKLTEKIHDIDDESKKLWEKCLIICQSNNEQKIEKLIKILKFVNMEADKLRN